MNILHITAHMGGGVGRAVSALVLNEQKNYHRIICLCKPEKLQCIDLCTTHGIDVQVMPAWEDILSMLAWSEVVVLHWWHHPTMVGFLSNFPEIPVRLILWAHISGCYYPMLPAPFLLKTQRIFFSTPYSYENREWTEKEREQIKEKSSVLYGSGIMRLPECPNQNTRVSKGKKSSYCIGYAGTFARSKINSGFVQACAEILKRLPNACFLLAGDAKPGAWIQKEAQQLGIQDRIKFTGFISDMSQFWRQIDIFGYPLNPQHFGTTDNIILEAMCAGVPMVLLNQASEKYIVSHLKDGILAESMQDYVEWIVKLQDNKELQNILAMSAAKKIVDVYDIKKIVNSFQKEIEKLNSLTKKPVCFSDVLGTEPADYLSCAMPMELRKDFIRLRKGQLLPEEKDIFFQRLPWILKEPSKSSIQHFAQSYPEDQFLKELSLKQIIYNQNI